MVIQHNMCAAFASRYLKENVNKTRKSVRNLSSGYRINTAADDAAGLTISEKMRWQIRGLNRASDNVQDGISLLQTADGALQEVHAMLQRMNELAVQAANDTNTDADRSALQDEIDQIKSEINRISTDTTFNTLKLFKPTNVPEITGNPTDVLVYHEDYSGGVREGGIIYNGKRYAYDNMNLSYDANGNINAGTYNVTVEGENGDDITIALMFDGGSRVPSGRQYVIEPSEEGISVDGIMHKWETMYDQNGVRFDKDNVQPGTYSFKHAGLTISFEVEKATDLASVIIELQPDGLDTYNLQSTGVTTVSTRINPYISITDVSVTAANQMYIPGNKTSNNSIYQMHADDTGIYMYIPSAYSNGQGVVQLTKMTWDDLGLTEFKEGESINPGSTVSGGELNSIYTYKDDLSGISIKFAIDSEVSKNELISAINSWSISVTTSNQMIFAPTTTGSIAITSGSSDHSSTLDTYGTQYAMGRTMSQQMTLASGQNLAYDSGTDGLSFTMTDVNGASYDFSASNITSGVTTKVNNDLSTYINSYITGYQNYLNHVTYYRSTPSGIYTRDVRFTSGSYWVDLNYQENLSGWLTDDMLDVSSSVVNGVTKYTVSLKSGVQSTLDAKAATLAANIVDSLKKTSMTVKTDTGVTASNKASSTKTTENKRYSSQVIPGDREVKIQAGCLAGQYIAIKLPAMNTGVIGIGGVDVTTHDAASAAISSINGAIDRISEIRSGYGATQNRLEAAMKIDDNTSENTQAAESLIRDADMAEESVAYAMHNVLVQCGQSMLAQANENLKDLVVQLLE